MSQLKHSLQGKMAACGSHFLGEGLGGRSSRQAVFIWHAVASNGAASCVTFTRSIAPCVGGVASAAAGAVVIVVRGDEWERSGM